MLKKLAVYYVRTATVLYPRYLLKFEGFPFGSITPYLVDQDGSLIILISTLAEHTKNIQQDSRVSLICHNQHNPHIQAQGRVTLLGHAQRIEDKAGVGLRYLRYFPETQSYFEMQDFHFYRIQPEAIRYIGGFGRIHWVKIPHYTVENAAEIALQEEAEMNTRNRQPDALKALLRQHYAKDTDEAIVIGVDVDGIDICGDGDVYRINFSMQVA